MAWVAKFAMLLAVAVAVTGLVAPPGMTDAAEHEGPVFGPLAFVVDEGGNRSCFEVFAREAGANQYQLYGEAKLINNIVVAQSVIGHLLLAGSSATWGLEVFPTAALAAAVKLGGIFALSTLLGNGSGFYLFGNNVFAFSFIFALVAATCAQALQT